MRRVVAGQFDQTTQDAFADDIVVFCSLGDGRHQKLIGLIGSLDAPKELDALVYQWLVLRPFGCQMPEDATRFVEVPVLLEQDRRVHALTRRRARKAEGHGLPDHPAGRGASPLQVTFKFCYVNQRILGLV